MPYSQLINLINNSNAVINLDNNKYESSIKNVCLQLGVPVVSNDFNEQSTLHKYINCDIVNKNCIINQDDLLNVVNMEKKSGEFKVESFKEKMAKFVGAL